jgi:hypothetical protein
MRTGQIGVASATAVQDNVESERFVNILIYAAEEYTLCDLRIDDHDTVILELCQLQRNIRSQQRENLIVVSAVSS